MFYAAAEGYRYTRNIKKYLLRLGIFALVSWLPFAVFHTLGDFGRPNWFLYPSVIYTIFMGVLGIHVRHKVKNPFAKYGLIFLLSALCLMSNWDYFGFFVIIIFEYFQGDFKSQALVYSLAVFLYKNLYAALFMPLSNYIFYGYADFTFLENAKYISAMENLGLFMPLILLYFYNGERGRGGKFDKWFFYWFYPLHLVVIDVVLVLG
jgi:hypothetical protein